MGPATSKGDASDVASVPQRALVAFARIFYSVNESIHTTLLAGLSPLSESSRKPACFFSRNLEPLELLACHLAGAPNEIHLIVPHQQDWRHLGYVVAFIRSR